MAHFEIVEREGLNLVKCTLQNETVRTESGAMYNDKAASDAWERTLAFFSQFLQAG